MRQYPGAPELAMQSPTILDAVAIYRSRCAGASPVDPLYKFLDSGYGWRAFGIPDSAHQTLAPRASFEDQISIEAGSFLVMVSSVSDQPEGFRWQLTDKGSKQMISSDYVRHGAGSGAGPVAGSLAGRPLPFIVPGNWVVSAPGLLTVQLTNMSPNANNVNLFFQFAEVR